MIKPLLLSLATIACSTTGLATSQFHSLPYDEIGAVTSISDNGRYATVLDSDDLRSFMWCIDNPDVFLPLDFKCELYDVTDDGTYIGSRYEAGKYYPGFYKDGQWTDLEVEVNAVGITMATCVTPDGSKIGGYTLTKAKDVATGGRYFPTEWVRNAEGEYDMKCYNYLDLSDHQGFYVNCMSPDGRVMAGSMYYGFAAQIPAFIIDGEFKIFETLTTREVPWYWNGKYQGDETAYYIDGYRDNSMDNTFTGIMFSADGYGNFYGIRTRVLEVDEEGAGTLQTGAAVYNYLTDEWKDNPSYMTYTCGIDQKYIFTGQPTVLKDGEPEDLLYEFDFDPEDLDVYEISKCSLDGRVLGGESREFVEAIMDYFYRGFTVVLDQPLVEGSAIPEIGFVGKDTGVVLSHGRIDFFGGEGSAYDLNGRLMGRGATVYVTPGAYIVKLAGESRKVMVK